MSSNIIREGIIGVITIEWRSLFESYAKGK
jgi:hypothetical protein